VLQEGQQTSSVLPRFERSCGRPTNRVLAKAANLPISFCACNSGLLMTQLVAYRLGNFALRLVAVILQSERMVVTICFQSNGRGCIQGVCQCYARS
jgi:hypothetical protein